MGHLMSKTPENANFCVDELYLQHAEALLTANLEPVEFPKLSKICKKEEEAKAKLNEKVKNGINVLSILSLSTASFFIGQKFQC